MVSVVVYVQKCELAMVVGLKTGSLSHVARQLASGVGESCAATGSDVEVQTTFFTCRFLRRLIMWGCGKSECEEHANMVLLQYIQ